MANLPAVLIPKAGEIIMGSNKAVNGFNLLGSAKNFTKSLFSGVGRMGQSYNSKNMTRAMRKRTGIAKDVADGKVTKNEKGFYDGISAKDRIKLAHMNADGTYNKTAIAGSALTVGIGAAGLGHAVFGADEVSGVPLI